MEMYYISKAQESKALICSCKSSFQFTPYGKSKRWGEAPLGTITATD